MIKNIFILMSVLLLNVSASVQAQEEYESLIDGDKCWYRHITHPDPDLVRSYTEEKICGPDTIVDGIRFKRKWYRSRRENESDFGEWIVKNWVGQDNGKIYCFYYRPEINPNYSHLDFIMDFAANVGDTLRTGIVGDDINFPFKVIAVSDTILESDVTHKRRKCLRIQEVHFENNEDIWVEGIGSLRNGIIDPEIVAIPSLMKVVANGDVIYQSANSGPDTGMTERNISVNKENATVYIYDMSGKLLTRIPLPHGEKMENIRVPRLGTGIFLYTLMVDGCEIDTKRVIISK